jgi:hypothetical protein
MPNDLKQFNIGTRILSWDVGIKHLAFCILEKRDNWVRILDWDNINLLAYEPKKCQGIKNNGKCCTSNAGKYYGDEYYCGQHGPDFLETKNTEKMCEHLVSGTKPCPKKGTWLQLKSDKSLCSTHYKQMAKGKKVKKVKCTGAAIGSLAEALVRTLDNHRSYRSFMTVNEVIIENQPSFLNPTMKTMSAMILGYFITRGIVERNVTQSNIQLVRFVSPSTKLWIKKAESIRILSKITAAKKYKKTKELGMQYTRGLLRKEPLWINHLDTYKKKDDLCDAYLQAYFYLLKK